MPIFIRRCDQDYYDSLIYPTNPRSPRSRWRLDLVSAHVPRGPLLAIGIGRGDLIRLAAVAPHRAQPDVRRAKDD